jgi:hypothetical protein
MQNGHAACREIQRRYAAEMQHGHAEWICNKDMQHDMQHCMKFGYAAWINIMEYGMYIEARTCSIDMEHGQHRHEAWTQHGIAARRRGHAARK